MHRARAARRRSAHPEDHGLRDDTQIVRHGLAASGGRLHEAANLEDLRVRRPRRAHEPYDCQHHYCAKLFWHNLTHRGSRDAPLVAAIGPCHVLLPWRSTSSSQYCAGPASAFVAASDHEYVRPPADAPRPTPTSAAPRWRDAVLRTACPCRWPYT